MHHDQNEIDIVEFCTPGLDNETTNVDFESLNNDE